MITTTPMTRDGSEALEARLARTCDEIGREIQRIVPAPRLQALLLGGGYGRGEGGVLATPAGDAPYNDLEFFVLIQGPPRLNERRFGTAIHDLGHRMTESLGIEVEFKIVSLEKLSSSGPSIFYYDLVVGHRLITGPPDILESCQHHADATRIPMHEALRLLMNRCSGLLFAAERLRRAEFTRADADFTGRNIAKAQLAMGDAMLATLGQYHWSCLERHQRLAGIHDSWGQLAEVVAFHQLGVEFKLHPYQSNASRDELKAVHEDVCKTAWAVWLWLEERRLRMPAVSPLKYGGSVNKCPETAAIKNALIRLRTFGLKGVFSPFVFRYPREALLNTLPLLLWAPELVPANAAWLSQQFVSPVSTWADALAAYARLWERFN
ncbi:MAG: hypothetical protein K9N23_11735 [Akkermansiaceae bacterium]|nr:hypothetical protein [Akkermansiaceae bacterium]